MDICNNNWRKDRITRDYVSDRSDLLQHPEDMTPLELCETITYCRTIENPYTEMLISKAGMSEQRKKANGLKELSRLLDSAAKSFGITLG